MVSINYSSREVNCKIVYYGPGLSGKTTNLQYVHSKVPKKSRGDLISLATEADRTLYFDFLPIDIGSIGGLTTKFQLYTVPGQVFYNATRKLVLRGVDGLVFVADSQRSKREENIESFNNLKDNLAEYGFDVNSIPLVLQYNKRDLPDLLPIDVLQGDLNSNSWPFFEASAVKGNGVFDTLKLITKLVLAKATSQQKSKAPVAVAAGDPGPIATDTGPVQTEQPPSLRGAAVDDIPKMIPRTSPPPAARGVDTKESTGPIPTPPAQKPAVQPAPAPIEKSDGSQLSGSEFGDSFEVPRVIGMQKSLKVKKKKKSDFSFFGLFRLFRRKKD
jgi:signal recognition particle receptor subunit beta